MLAGKVIGIIAVLVAVSIMLVYVYGFREFLLMVWNSGALVIIALLVVIFAWWKYR